MAATRLIALHVNKGKTVAQCLADRTDYSENLSVPMSVIRKLPTKNFFSPNGSISISQAENTEII